MNFHIYSAIAFHERQILDVSSVTDCKMNGQMFHLELVKASTYCVWHMEGGDWNRTGSGIETLSPSFICFVTVIVGIMSLQNMYV